MTCQEAYNAGKQAFRDGEDVLNIPSHYTETERELFIVAYEEESRLAENQMYEEDFEDEYEASDFFDSSEEELDFNS